MNLTPVLIFLHITVMFAAITVAYGGGLVMRMAFMTGQVTALRGVGMSLARLAPLIPILFISGGTLGLLAAISFGQNLLAPWLVIAYVLFAAAMLIGMTENRSFAKELGGLLAKTPDGPVSPEIRAMFTNTRVVGLTLLEYLIVVVLIFDMVVKPFS